MKGLKIGAIQTNQIHHLKMLHDGVCLTQYNKVGDSLSQLWMLICPLTPQTPKIDLLWPLRGKVPWIRKASDTRAAGGQLLYTWKWMGSETEASWCLGWNSTQQTIISKHLLPLPKLLLCKQTDRYLQSYDWKSTAEFPERWKWTYTSHIHLPIAPVSCPGTPLHAQPLQAHGSLVPQKSAAVKKDTGDFHPQCGTKWLGHEIWSGFSPSIQKSQAALSRRAITRTQRSFLL